MDQDLMVLGHTSNKGLVAYGAIQEQNAVRENRTQMQYCPVNWIQPGDPAIEFVQTHSAPQPIPADITKFVVVKVK